MHIKKLVLQSNQHWENALCELCMFLYFFMSWVIRFSISVLKTGFAFSVNSVKPFPKHIKFVVIVNVCEAHNADRCLVQM